MTPEERKQLSMEYHAKGYNCCQSVLLACGDLTGLPEETAAPLGYGFGSGMHCGEVCGAVTGGLMAIGASMPEQSMKENRPLAVAASKELEGMFRAQLGTLLCREILAEHGRRICDTCIACCAEAAGTVIDKLKRGEYQK